MLLPGTRRNLFTTAYNDLSDILLERENKQPGLLATAYKELNKSLNGFIRVQNAIREVKGILRDNKRNPLSWSWWNHAPAKEEELMEKGVESEDAGSKEESKEDFMYDTWALAQGSLALGEEKLWEVIQGV
jgi:hypothetical protein